MAKSNVNKELNSKIYDVLAEIAQASTRGSVELVSNGFHNSFSSRWLGSRNWLSQSFPCPHIFIGDASQAKLAYILGLLPKDGCCAIINPDTFDINANGDLMDRYRELAPLAYDTTSPDSQIGTRQVPGMYRSYTMPSYSGELDKTFVLSYTKAGFVAAMSDCWQENFLMDDWGRHNCLRTIGRSKALAKGLTLGDVEIYVPSGRGTGSKLGNAAVSFLNACNITVTSDDERVTKSIATLNAARDYSLLWKKQADERNMAIRIKEDTLNDEAKTLEIFKMAAETLEMDAVIKAYKLGVPAEDLVA